jgi:hypothetical protein
MMNTNSRSASFPPPALRRSSWAVLLLLGCASPQLETGKNHPANAAAPTAEQSVGGALDADFDPRAGASAAPASDPHAGHAMGAKKPPGGSEPTGDSPGAQRTEPAESAPAAGSKPHAEHEPSGQSTEKPQDGSKQWTCPMHPEIVKTEPGNCPICGMKLKPKAPEGGPR